MIRKKFNTAGDLFVEYLSRSAEQQARRTFDERRRLLTAFAAHVGDLLIDNLIPDDLERWIESNAQWKSDWTRLRVAGTIKRPFSWAVKKGLLDKTPFASVSYPPGQRGQPISDKWFGLLLRNFGPEFRRVLLFMSLTGVRPCELASMQWDFVDPDQGTVTLYVHKTARTRKDRAPRVLYLPAKAVKMLVWILARQDEAEKFVFLNKRGRPWNRNSLSLRIWRARKRLGIPTTVKLYGARHSWATQLAESGMDLKTLSVLLGHTSTRMSEYYIHLAGKTQHLRAALEKGLAK